MSKKSILKIYRNKVEIKNPNKSGDYLILSILKNKKINLIFSEEVSYVFQATIPSKLKKIEEMNYILDLVTKHIPEDLNNHIWGYKVLSKNKEKKHIVIFSPIKEIYEQVKELFEKYNIKVVRFETSQIARLYAKSDFEGVLKENKTTIKFENKKLSKTNFVNLNYKFVWIFLTTFSSAIGSLLAFSIFTRFAS